jgi:tRNA U55 pseudouridine synthase TruB
LLRRLAVGSFTIDEAHTLDAIEADRLATLVSPVDAMRGLERADVDAATARGVAHGSVFPSTAFTVSGPGPYAVVDEAGALLAVYEQRGAGLKPSVVLPPHDVSGS